MSVIIIDKTQFEEEYSGMDNILFWNCLNYVNKKKLRNDFNLKGRFLYILAKQRMNPTYCDLPNLRIDYEQIQKGDIIEHPNGDILIVIQKQK